MENVCLKGTNLAYKLRNQSVLSQRLVILNIESREIILKTANNKGRSDLMCFVYVKKQNKTTKHLQVYPETAYINASLLKRDTTFVGFIWRY